MRLAVVSDIHGNLTALEAVIADIERRGVERVVHGGDLALGGCQPAEVIDRIRELGWPGIIGNTDELLWRPDQRERQQQRAPKLSALIALLFDQWAPATRQLLGEDRIAWLRRLAGEHREQDLALVHASPGDLWLAPQPDAEDSELVARYGSRSATVAVYGHIHRPYVRELAGLTVANTGSVGSPYDGDARASYLMLDSGRAQIVRVAYDIDHELDRLRRSSYPDAARIAQTRREGKFIAVAPPA